MSNDSRTQNAVLEKLSCESGSVSKPIGAAADYGIVATIRRLAEVTCFSDGIAIRPRPDAHDIWEETNHARHRCRFFGPNTITVSTQVGTVTLCGTFHGRSDRPVAAMTAWSTAGVTAVRNDIAMR